MAVRIPVVLCQHERRNGKHAEHEEQWITSLLFADGLDATLVADLPTIELDSTDHLCLEGLRGDFVLVSWQSPESAVSQLSRLGLQSAELIPLDGRPKISSHPMDGVVAKKVYFLSFDLDQSFEIGLGRIKNLLASRSTPVFQLAGLSKQSMAHSKSAPASLPVVAQPTTLPVTNIPVGLSKESQTSGASFPDLPKPAAQEDGDDFPHIDSLMQDLDKFDG